MIFNPSQRHALTEPDRRDRHVVPHWLWNKFKFSRLYFLLPSPSRFDVAATNRESTLVFIQGENMGRPTADANVPPKDSLTVRDNRTGKVYTIP